VKNIEHPYDLDKPNLIDKITSRIAGFIGGGVTGLATGALGSVVLTKLDLLSLTQAFFCIVGSVIILAIIGALWPRWFARIILLLPF
jgi:uncharacterized membrane protein YeaQ/YmgE (transglycosylase-associated protein family)